MVMKGSCFLLATLTATAVQGFVPVQIAKTAPSGALHAVDQDGNHIPAGNKFFPKAPKKLVGDFYGELNTQKELKVPKTTTPAPPAPATPPAHPLDAVPPPPPAAATYTPPPPPQTTVPPPPPPATNMGQDGNNMPTRNGFFPKADQRIVGDFYGELNANNNGGIPPKNKFYPKAPKKLIGDFYGELNTQKELKVPKTNNAAPAAAVPPPPAAAAVPPPPAAQTYTPPPPPPQAAAAVPPPPPPVAATMTPPSTPPRTAATAVGRDFYGELHANNNGGHPPHNKFYPKAPKKLIGDFYGELKTQKELKVPKKEATSQALPRPEVTMQQQQQSPSPPQPPQVTNNNPAVPTQQQNA